MLERLKSRARALQTEIRAISLAAGDPRTPWVARVLILLVLAYALSPIDLIPDFVPVLGYLDDLVIVPAGIALALKLIPPEVMEQARKTAAGRGMSRAKSRDPRGGVGLIGAGVILLTWISILIWISSLLLHFVK